MTMPSPLLLFISAAAMLGSSLAPALPGGRAPMGARARPARTPPAAAFLASVPVVGADDAPREVRRAGDGMFYVRASVNGAPVRFLVDTGASHVILTAADARRVRAGARERGTLATAGGARRLGWTTLRSVRLAGREAHDVRAGIASSGLPVSLLGQNMLARLPALRIEGDRLRLF